LLDRDGGATARDGGVTFRVVALSLTLATVFGYALPVIDYKLNNTFLGGAHLPPGAIGVLLVLVLIVNPLLRWLSPRWRLSRNEALTVYITCLFSSLVPGHGAENFIVPNLIAPFYYATQENKWLEILQPYLKPWLTPALTESGTVNRAVVEGWYVGAPEVPWGAWMVPLVFWVSFVLVSYVMLGCLSVMLRAQWAEHEALAFPLLRLPLTMTEDLDQPERYGTLGRFFRTPAMWIGFGIAVFIQLMRGLNLYYPDVPTFPLEINTGPLFSDAPWNQIGWVPINIYPMVVGVTYLLTSEISFSLWFFFWFFKLQYVISYYLGYPVGTLPNAEDLPDKIFTGYQVGGCYLAYVAIVLWTARRHLAHVTRRAFGRAAPREVEKTELMSYPTAFWGFALSFALMIAASCVAGMRIDLALALWVSYLVLAIGMTRIAVEGGVLALQHHTNPLGAIAKLIDTGPGQWLSPASGVSSASFFQAGMVNHMRGFIMPSFIHSFKLAHDHKIAAKPLLVLISATVIISVIISWCTAVRLGYENGGLGLGHRWWAQDGSRMPAYFLESVNRSSAGSALTAWLWLGVGATLTYGMMLARSRFTFFPFHPIGYLISLTYPGHTFWSSIFWAGWPRFLSRALAA
jgi:hypothetical protein